LEKEKAIGKSKLGPSLRTVAGAKLMVIFPRGRRSALLLSALNDPISALLDRGMRQTNYGNPSLRPPPGVHQDMINQIIQRFASPNFHCRLTRLRHPGTGHEHAIIGVPGGFGYPDYAALRTLQLLPIAANPGLRGACTNEITPVLESRLGDLHRWTRATS
jgi:hypothetical protein